MITLRISQIPVNNFKDFLTSINEALATLVATPLAFPGPKSRETMEVDS